VSNFDRQVTNALRRMHLEAMGPRIESSCRWYYNSKNDVYHCPHAAIFGKDLMARIPDWNKFNQGPATDHHEHRI
jgi:hypothetical protein